MNEKNDLSELSKIGNAVRKRDMVSEDKQDLEKN